MSPTPGASGDGSAGAMNTPRTKAEGIDLWASEMESIAKQVDSIEDEASADAAIAEIKTIQGRLRERFSGMNAGSNLEYMSIDPQQIAAVQGRMGQALMGLQMRSPQMMKRVTRQLKETPEIGAP